MDEKNINAGRRQHRNAAITANNSAGPTRKNVAEWVDKTSAGENGYDKSPKANDGYLAQLGDQY